jgi:hypothetical protein
VAEELLDLPEVRSRAQELRGEHVAERVRGDVLALGDPGGAGVAEESLGQDRLRQPLALNPDEERGLGVVRADPEVVDEERLEGGMNRHGPLAAALGAADLKQATFEVDVGSVEPEQLAAAQARVGEQREEQPVTLALTVMVALPHVIALGDGE